MRRRILTLAAAVMPMAFVPYPAMATCPANTSNPVQHALGGWFTNCSDAEPVGGFIYTLGSADTINSAGVDVVCEVGGAQSGQGIQCQPEPGVAGDGIVTVSFDYGNPGTFPGCPNPDLLFEAPRQVIHVIADDGSSVLTTVGWARDLAQYGVDFSQPDSFPPGPLECGSEGHGIEVLRLVGGTLEARLVAPLLHSDCDPGTWGVTGGGFIPPTCDAGTLPSVATGRLFYTIDQCAPSPTPLLSAGWVLLATPDPSGAVTANVPLTDVPESCTFVGVTATIGGVETPAIVGFIRVPGTIPVAPRALGVQARREGGDVVVKWFTESESGLLGFHVHAIDPQGKKGSVIVTESPIAPQGDGSGGGASYEIRLRIRSFRGWTMLAVESLLTSGGSIFSDRLSF